MTDNTQNESRQTAERDDATDKVRVTGDTAARTPRKSRAGTWLALLILLFAAGAGGGAFLAWKELRDLSRELAYYDARLQALGEHLESDYPTTGQLESRLREQQVARERLQERVVSLEQGLAALRNNLQGGRTAWLRAEVRHLLRIANQELSIARDPAGALAALRAADRRLQELADPALHPVRARIREEIAALQALPDPDITGMALTLDALAARAAGLPLASRPRDSYQPEDRVRADTESGLWDRLWSGLADTFGAMVTIRRNATPARPLLTPEQEYFLRQNLRLQLESARMALLAGDGANFRASLVTARDWLNRWYATEDPAVQAILADIEGLLEQPMPAELPDISGSLDMLDRRTADEGAD